MATQHFGLQLWTEYWINGKAVFSKPIGVDITFIMPEAFDWVIADTNGVEAKAGHNINALGGWTSLDFASLGLFDDYPIPAQCGTGVPLCWARATLPVSLPRPRPRLSRRRRADQREAMIFFTSWLKQAGREFSR
jgi:hypothetical protein